MRAVLSEVVYHHLTLQMSPDERRILIRQMRRVYDEPAREWESTIVQIEERRLAREVLEALGEQV